MARTPLLNTIQKYFRIQAAKSDRLSSLDSTPTIDPTRRDFVFGAGALAIAASFPNMASAKNSTNDKAAEKLSQKPSPKPAEKRIAIIGGGMAGFSCALKLADHKIKATVYEASPRIGGRMFSNTGYWNDNQVSEWCGELIDTGHVTMQRLARRFQLPLDQLLEAQPKGSEDTFYFDGQYYPLADFISDIEPVITRVNADLALADFPTSYEKSTAEGRELDRMTVYDWIETRVQGGHASLLGQLLDAAYLIEYGAETKDQSALNLVYLLGYQPKKGNPGVFGESDEAFHIRGGNENLPRAIAQSFIQTMGADKIVLGKQLIAIEKTNRDEYRLTFKATTAEGSPEQIIADIVVLALPFSVLREVDLSRAGFSDLKLKAIQDLGMGRNGKTQLQFKHRIWNGTGAWPGKSTGSTYSDMGYLCSWDVTRAQAGQSGILNFFTGGKVTENLSCKQPFTSSGNAHAREDARTLLQAGESVYPGLGLEWNEKFTESIPHLHPLMRASYAFYRPGQYTLFGGYEKVVEGKVHFAGDHTSENFQGFMEGAASEGERAAEEIIRDK